MDEGGTDGDDYMASCAGGGWESQKPGPIGGDHGRHLRMRQRRPRGGFSQVTTNAGTVRSSAEETRDTERPCARNMVVRE